MGTVGGAREFRTLTLLLGEAVSGGHIGGPARLHHRKLRACDDAAALGRGGKRRSGVVLAHGKGAWRHRTRCGVVEAPGPRRR